MTMKERLRMIDQIVAQVDDWELEDLIEYVKEHRRQQISKCSDTCVQLEWDEWCT